MAFVSIYLNYMGNAEEAFEHYKKVFNTEYSTPLMRIGDMPDQEGMPPLSDEDKKKVMHVAITVYGTQLMATDMLESMGHQLILGNNITISLNPDSKAEADRLFTALNNGSKNAVAPHDEFWGYWGCCTDKFGVQWMFNVSNIEK
ncbi:MAG TPA: VOC family protein [Chitinophagales bacterium]|nr:VOC family protein [Chitinophagales bacterium]HMW11363.1 VOC family protein [Bacteroidia bacterium]HMX61046.1 VOC family protein [Chitinophagales bacterium]HMY24341.1 VOC family protein [Chitinophagales bacterium]HMZ34797.1 VOC family protein [Chitinophagales bacterium]